MFLIVAGVAASRIMAYGRLNAEQAKLVKQFAKGQVVTDLGAGDLTLARQLLKLGATKVHAVEKEAQPRPSNPRIEVHSTYFRFYKGAIDVAFCSWPCNWQDVGLTLLLFHAPIIIYLGKNTDGTSCGGDEMWQYLRTREVLAYAPDRPNTLIVYGPQIVAPRDTVYGEEKAAIDRYVGYFNYDDLEKTSNHEHTKKQA